MEARDFFQLQVDPCVWYTEEMVLLFYVDDCLFFVLLSIKLMNYMSLFRHITR